MLGWADRPMSPRDPPVSISLQAHATTLACDIDACDQTQGPRPVQQVLSYFPCPILVKFYNSPFILNS